MDIFLQINESREGPFTVDQIKNGIESGRFGLSTLAWRPGAKNWVCLNSFLNIGGELTGTTPTAQKSESKVQAIPNGFRTSHVIIVCATLILGILLLSNGGNKSVTVNQPTYDRAAMINVWNTIVAAEDQVDWKKKNGREQYQIISNLDLRGCSPSFKEAFLNYCGSVIDLISYRESNVDLSVADGILTGAINSLTRGEIDGGATRINETLTLKANNYTSARQRLRMTLDEPQ